MIAEVVATGEEILLGAVLDSNSAYIAGKLQDSGIAVVRHTCVGDDLDLLVAAFKEIGSRADIAVVTGGLGPTGDDLTAEAAARAGGVTLAFNSLALQSVENFFKARQREMNSASRKQAFLPAGAECLQNPIGTAPGFRLQIGRCLFYFLPGVPGEMHRMLSDSVLPQLIERMGDQRCIYRSQTLSTFGFTESQTFERLAGLKNAFPQVSLGLQVRFPTIQVKLYTHGTDERQLDDDLRSVARWVVEKMGDKVFSRQGDPMEKVVGHLLRKAQGTLALAESCTGGLIADMLTNVSGSSDYFVFCGITYSNQAKINVLKVPAETIRTHGAVHEETAVEMARGARSVSGASYGLATSGIAGPTGGSAEKPVGTVCIGLATPQSAAGYRFHFPTGSRTMNKQMFAMAALEVLRRELLGLDPPRF
jgi:nicotinamide-nucleotide amidase